MPEYLAPGVYVEEIERGPRPIEGVSTSTAALLGEAERGPIWPTLVTSYAEYEHRFGGAFADGRYMPDAVNGFFENGGRRVYICRIGGNGATAARLDLGGLLIEAIGPGEWGNRIRVRLSAVTGPAGAEPTPTRFRLQLAYWREDAPGGIYPDPFDQPAATPKAALIEEYDNLLLDQPDSPNDVVRMVGSGSVLVRISRVDDTALDPVEMGDLTPLASGVDGARQTVSDYGGDPAGNGLRSGLAALDLDDFREVALIAAPAAAPDVADAIRTHCERNRYRFAVIDCDANVGDPASLDPRKDWDSGYAAFHYPWIYTSDLQSGGRRLVPPSGHVLGVYARVDTERGVWKAPANEILRGVLDLPYQVDERTQEVLNPRGVNIIRAFTGRGIRLWGARTLSSDAQWKYVSVRRHFIFLERSIEEGTRWVVFEPNGERLWEQVKDTIRQFLRTQWRDGALMGVKEEQAFFVKCDRSTMTQNDIDNGRLICEIGVAPLRPAEFVILRIFQNTSGVDR